MKKRWIAFLCAAALTVTMMGGAAAAESTNTGTGPVTAGFEWTGTDLYANEGVGQIKVIVQCDTGQMNVELMDGQGKFLKKQTLAADGDSSFTYYINRDTGQSGRYHLKWRGINGQNATGSYFWVSIRADGSQSRWNEVFGDQPWSADGTVTVRVNSVGTEERLPIYTSLYPYALREVTGALSDPDTFQGENGGLSRVDFRRDLSIAPMIYGNLPAMFYRFNANGKKILIKLNALGGSVTDGCDLLIKNETTGEFLAWVPGMIPGDGGGIVLSTEYGMRYGIYAASGSDTLGTAQLSITDDLPINEAEVPDSVLLAGARKSGTFGAKATWDGIGLQIDGSVEAFRLVVQCDTGSMTVRVVDDNNHLVKPTQFLAANSDSEASSFNLVIERAEGYTGSYGLWWIGADGQAATGSYAWRPIKEDFEPGMDGQLPATTVTGTENPFRFPYKDVSIDGGGGDYSGCAYQFKLEDGENYFRVAVRNDLAPEIGNITVGIYREGDKFAYVSYDARPGEWTPPIVVRGVPGTTYTVILRKNAGTPELVQGLLSIKCAPGVFE